MKYKIKIKLLCVDIDGTLLDSDKRVPKINKEAIQYAVQKNVIVAIATGRSVNGMQYLFKELGVTEENAICLNGGLVLCKGKIIYKSCMDEHIVSKIVDIVEKYQSQIFLSTAQFNITNAEVSADLKKQLANGSLKSNQRFCKNYDELRENAEKYKELIIKAAIKETDEKSYYKIRQELLQTGLVEAEKSDTHYVDIIEKNSGKGRGVETLAAHLQIPMSEVMCIGDNENDRTMIETAGVGVAMGNAVNEVKKAAQYITSDNNSGGVAQAIYHFISEDKSE